MEVAEEREGEEAEAEEVSCFGETELQLRVLCKQKEEMVATAGSPVEAAGEREEG